MWSLRTKANGELYLTYDFYRRPSNLLRGLWEFIGKKDLSYTNRAIEINKSAGHLCCNDDEGNVRVLVLEE